METMEITKGPAEKWDDCKQIIHDNIGDLSFESWFEPISFVSYIDNILTLAVPTKFWVDQIESNYVDLLGKVLFKIYGKDTRLHYAVRFANNENPKSTIILQGKTTAPKNTYRPGYIHAVTNTNQTPIMNPFLMPGIAEIVDSQLNPSYTFDNFIEGDCNRLARNAGLSIAQNIVKSNYNPFFIYGKSGLGKTHLVQAIGTQIKELYPHKNVIYVDAETFERQYTQSSLEGKRNDFQHFYQSMDVIILEDVQMFANKVKTQDAFFQIFNHLQLHNKQIILTSDCPPVELTDVQGRLLNRFKWGLMVELTTPNFETRLAILKQKIEKEGLDIDEEVVEYIANHITTNIRELEGVLISILAQATITKRQLNLDLAKEVVEKIVKSSQQDISIESIKKSVCEYFGIDPSQLHDKTRKREIVQSRQIAMYFAKMYTKNSLASIGKQIGGKDHATVLHACKTVNNLMETDKRFKRYIVELEKRFKLQ